MQKIPVSIGLYQAFRNASPDFMPSKPRFSFAKTKEKLAEYFFQNEQVRLLDDANKEMYPRMHQSVQGTAWQLLMYYMKNWGKATARDYEIRITYSYLRKSLNESCCVATLKNHVNKLLKMYRGLFTAKFRGGLGLEGQNTACFILKVQPEALLFDEPRHNEAIEVVRRAQEQQAAQEATAQAQARAGAGAIMRAANAIKTTTANRMAAPQSIQNLILAALGTPPFLPNS